MKYVTTNDNRLNVSRFAQKSHKVSWERDRAKLSNVVKKLNELEEIISSSLNFARDKIDERSELLVESSKLRETLVLECIHPAEELVELENGLIRCEFCNTLIRMMAVSNDKDV